MATDARQVPPDQFYPGQVVLWTVGMAALFAELIVGLSETGPAWLQRLPPWGSMLFFACIGLSYNRRLFKPLAPLPPDVRARARRNATRGSFRVGFWVALSYALGASIGASQVPVRLLVLSGLGVTVVIASGVNLWLQRVRGTPPTSGSAPLEHQGSG